MSLLDLLNEPPAQSTQGGIQNPYKTSEQAYQQDVVPRARQGSGSLLDLLGDGPAPAVPAPPPAPARAAPPSGDFARGFGIAGKQLKQTAYGAAALIGDTVGSDSLKDWGLKGYKEGEKEIQAVSKPSDSFTTALDMGGGAVVDWLQYAGGYLTAQALELGAASLAGAAIGGAAAGPAAPVGATAGAITGAVNKAAVQTGIRGAVSKMIDKEAAALTAKYIAERGMAKEVAEKAAAEAAMKSVYRTIGATAANTFLNATQELGSIYGEAVEEAAKTGEEYSLGRIWLAGIAATAVDTWADSKAVKGLTDAFKGRNRASSIAIEAFKGGLREGLTEGAQTVIERWGADKDLATREAFKEYIDSAAIGVLGGTTVGGVSGAVSKLQAPAEVGEDQTKPNITRLPTAEDRRETPVDFDGNKLQMREDVEATLNRPDLMAALYMRGDETQRETIRRAIERAGLMNEFSAALQNPKALEAQNQIVEEFPDLLPNMVSGLDIFANTLPDRTFKVDQRTTGGTLEAERKAEEEAARQGTTPNPPVVEEPNDPAVVPKDELPARTGPQDDTRNAVITQFNEVGTQIFGMNPGSVQDAKFDWAMNQLVKTHGFSTADARAILTGELMPSQEQDANEGPADPPPQTPPNLGDQGALDEAVGNAEEQGFGEAAKVFELPLSSVRERGDDNQSPWLTGDGRIMATGGDHLSAIERGTYSDHMRATGHVRAMFARADDGSEYTVALHLFPGQKLTPQQLATVESALRDRKEPSVNLIVGEQDGMENPAYQPFTLDELRSRFGPEADSKPATPPKTESQKATEDLKDAAANFFDVLTDALGTKKNITGPQYTTKDLPDALVKVMVALGKKGIVTFKDAVREAMKLMRASQKGWAPLADKVTPRMLRDAYNAAGIEGKDSPESVAAVTTAEMRALVNGEQAPAKPVQAAPAQQDTKPPSEEELLAAEISQLEADIEAENRRLTEKYAKGKKGTTDWTKAGVATGKDLDFEAMVKELEKLEAMRDQLKKLVDKQREEAKFAKPASGGRPEVDEEADLKEDTAKTTYRKVERQKPAPRRSLPASELTPNMKRLLSKLNQDDQKERLKEWGSLSPEGLEAAKREVDEIAERSDRRALERINETPRVRAFRAKAEKIVSLFNDRQGLRDTVTAINQRIAEIDERLKAMKYVNDGRTRFEAISEEDENAYLWSNEQGLRIPKETSVEKLLALKRSLTEDLREARTNSTKFGAAMVKRNIKRIEYELERARQDALEGLPQRPAFKSLSELTEKRSDERGQIQAIYDDLRLSVTNIMAGLDRPARTDGTVGLTPESSEEAVADTFDKDTAVYGILREVLSGKTKPDEATAFLARGMREGLFTVDDILRNAQVAGLSIPGDTIARYTNISLTSRMLDYARANGYTPLSRHQWLNAMHQVMRTLPGGKGGTTYELYYTDAERAAYEEWLENAQNLALRRKEDPVMLTSMDPRDAFKGMLFIDYRLYQMRNPDMIENGRAREMLKGTIDNLPSAWHVDLYFALKKRPDLKQALFENELTDAEVEAHNEWLRQREAAAAKNVEVAARTPYFQELANLDAALPLSKGRSQDALERSKREGDDTERGSYYERVYRALATAKLDELDTVMAHARDLYQMTREKAAGKTGFEEMIDDYLDFFAAQDQARGGASIEEFADSFVEGAREDVEGMADSRGPMLSDEDLGASPDYEVEYDEDGNPKELRLRRGPYSGAVSTMNVVSEVADITSTWPNAPHVEVVQNVTQLPDGVRERVMAKLGAGPGAKGVYVDGRVYLFSDHLTGRADIEFTLFHEAYGHLGMRAALGNKFDQFLETAYRTRPDVKKAVDALVAEGMPRLEAIDEVLSDMAAENRNVSVVKQWVGKIISGLREIGLGRVADWLATMTDGEVASTLNAARDAARSGVMPAFNGAPSEIRFKTARMPYEIFANKAGKTTGYARYNPSTDTWVVFTATGADIKDGHTAVATQDYDEVVRAMRSAGKVEYRTRSGVFVDDKIVADLVAVPKLNDQGKYGILDKRSWSKWRRNAQISFQNEYLPVFEVVDYLASIGRLTDQIDVKTALTLYERRTGYLVEQFRKEYVEPIAKLVEQAGNLGVTKKDIDRYLAARHTNERNNAVAKVNPGMQDGGSGLTYAEALKIIAQVESSPAARVMSEIARKTDMMGKEKIRYLMDTGMITKAAGKKLLEYDHYVNLSGERDADPDFDDPGQIAGGSKFNVKGKEKRAFGRGAGNEAENVLARTIQAYEAALIRGQKNLVAQKVLALFETNYDPSAVIINAQPRLRQLNPETGLVEEVIDENYMARKDVMVAKINGIPSTIEFKDNTRGSFAEAIHGMVVPRTSAPIMEAVGKVTRMLGALLTTYNPAFTLVNFVRDVQTMYIQAAADGRITKKMARDMIRVLPGAMKAAIHEASGGRYGKGADPEMLRVLREMQQQGGITYFADRLNLEEQVAKIDALLSGKKYPGQKKVEVLLGILEFGANVSEIAPRLAAYKVVSDNGFSKEQAATFSGEITVNFNMRGANREMRQLFLFFNPAVQGGYKIHQLWKSPEGRKKFYGMAAALTIFGMLTSYIGRAVSGEDDDGIDKLDKVPVYKRATSVVIKADSFFGAPLPIPYGWNAFFAFGVFMADTLQGKQPLSVSAARIAKTTAEAFSPIGMGAMDAKSFETFMAKFVAPTVALPVVEFLANENRFGAPIRKEQSPFDFAKTPDAQSYFRGVSPISRGITETLTELTYGNKYQPGKIDVNPATIDFLIQSYLPGLPSDLYKGASIGIRAAQGEEIKRAPWPVFDRFSARIPTGYDAGAYRRAAELVETVYKEYSNIKDQGRRAEIRQEYPRLGYAHAAIASTKQELRDIRQQIAALEERKMSDEARVERRNQLLEREERVFKRAVKRLMQAGEPVREAMMANE